METNTKFETLKELAGMDSILKILKEAGEKAGEAKDWERVGRISRFTEALHEEMALQKLPRNSSEE